MGLDYTEWRGGLLMGDAVSLALWKEQPGQMALIGNQKRVLILVV